MLSGFLVVDKPAGLTSHDVVGMVRAVTGVKKVGHTGTLDPFATGVLPLALGSCTRLIQFLDESHKVYDATVLLGQRTDTGDLDGEVVQQAPVPALTAAEVRSVLDGFVGQQLQTPPAYSAVKKDGKRLYEYAREGVEVSVPPRTIVVHSIELVALGNDSLRLRVACGRGTYVRVLGEDIASRLGTLGHLTALRREKSGPFEIEGSLTADELGSVVAAEPGHSWESVLRGRKRDGVAWKARDDVRAALQGRLLRPLGAMAHLPLCHVDDATATRVQSGQRPPPLALAGSDGRYAVVHDGRLLAIARMRGGEPTLERVLPLTP